MDYSLNMETEKQESKKASQGKIPAEASCRYAPLHRRRRPSSS